MIMIRNEDGQDICYVSWRVILLSLYYFGIYKNIRLKGKRRFSRKYFDKSFCVYFYKFQDNVSLMMLFFGQYGICFIYFYFLL